MVGERRRVRDAKESMSLDLWWEEGRSEVLLSKRETRRATAIVVVIVVDGRVAVRDKESDGSSVFRGPVKDTKRRRDFACTTRYVL